MEHVQNEYSGLSYIERPDPMSSEVARRLLDFLLSGEIASGQRLPSERQLATLLGVGRSGIREALKPLQLLGLLEVRVGDGTYLQESDSKLLPQVIEWGLLLNAQRINELVETRRYIEIPLAGLAAIRRSDDFLAQLGERLEAMTRSTHDVESFAKADSDFHLAIADAAQNSILAGVLRNLRSLLDVWINRVAATPGEPKRAISDHRAIVAAIRAGNRSKAELAMATHIDRVTAKLSQSLAEAASDKVNQQRG